MYEYIVVIMYREFKMLYNCRIILGIGGFKWGLWGGCVCISKLEV